MIKLEEILERSNSLVKQHTVSGKRFEHDEANKETIKRIEEKGFIINRFEVPKQDEYEAIGLFYCQYKNWIFPVREIANGPLLLIDPRNIKTGEKIPYYCDLLCVETSRMCYLSLLKVMNVGFKNYLEKTYSHYLKLPELLSVLGYEVDVKDMKFDLFTCEATLLLNRKIYIRIYKDETEETVFALTNSRTWKAETNQTRNSFGEKAYYFSYNGREDLVELQKCLQAFEEELDGEYGFLEENRYYRNEDIGELINDIKHRLTVLRKTNTRLIEKKTLVDHYRGMDIYKEFLITFDHDDKQESYNLLFQYDRKQDETNCLLQIDSAIKTLQQEVLIEDQCVLKGPFTTLSSKMIEFLWTLFEIHDVKLM